MNEHDHVNELLMFFKTLADANRLRIIGLLARCPYSVEQLAEELGLAVSTTSHHLGKLAKSGLVKASVDGHFYIYSLQTDVLQDMAQRLLVTESLPRLSDENQDVFERKVMSAFVDADGVIKAFPAQEKKFLVLLHYVLKAFESGVRYTEKEVNEILSRFNEDTASLRRGLIEYQLMAREGGGRSYWRL